jgi:hypothetical protein
MPSKGGVIYFRAVMLVIFLALGFTVSWDKAFAMGSSVAGMSGLGDGIGVAYARHRLDKEREQWLADYRKSEIPGEPDTEI